MEEKKTLKGTIGDLKSKAEQKFDRTKDWCRCHKSEIISLTPILISGTIEIVKIVSKNRNIGAERYLKENYIYDRSAGHYYELKRQPKSSEWTMIDHRKSNGELLGDILKDMNLLR
jgi:hypothetical protein